MIEVVKYTENKKNEWNEFVINSNNGTLFHNLDFLSYHGEKFVKNESHLMFYNEQNLVGVMPLALFEKEDKVIAKSPYGGSFGGVVAKEYMKFRHSEELVNVMMQFLKDNKIDEIYITPPPSIYSRVPNCYIEFNLLKNNFKLINREITSVICLGDFKSDPFDIFEKRSERAVKKAKREGFEVIENSNEYESFYKILKETTTRHNTTPTHTFQELKKIHDKLPHFVKLDMALIGGESAAGILYFICNSRTVLTFYICHRICYNKLHPVNLLLYHGIMWAKKNGYRYMDLGTTTQNMNARNNLFMFKESFGSVGHFRDTFVLKNFRDREGDL